MRKIITLISVSFLPGIISAQLFTKITSGVIVTDGKSTVGSSWIDLDQDGDLDLFNTTAYSENDRFYLNNGAGSFTLASNSIGSLVTDGKQSYNSTWGDYDNDGFEDVYITYGASNTAVNGLFHNNGNGTFTQITTGIAVNDPAFSDGSSWADYDNDGFIDLFVTHINNHTNSLYHNNGNGTFTKITTGSVATDVAYASASPAWGDYDNDGFPDLFVSNFGGTNFLYHNNGNGTFTKITSGSIVTDFCDAHGASWGDYDNDGYLDLFVNCFFNQNDLLYHNNGNGTFTKITTTPITSNSGYGTGSSWGDYDNDGDLDLFVCNSSADAGGNSQYNKLYMNNGNGTFNLVTTGTFQTDVSNGRSATWCDYDHDGDLDLHVANEYYSNDFFYQNNGNSNHSINIKCHGITSNKSAIGTTIWVKANINGQPVWQNNFVSSQTGYAGQNSLNVEFGFGSATLIDSMIVKWPSGLICYYSNIPTNQFINVFENCNLTSIETISQTIANTSLSVNPNPNSGNFYISFFSSEADENEITIYDALGKKVFSKMENFKPGLNKILIESSINANGIYFIRIKSADQSFTQKIVISGF